MYDRNQAKAERAEEAKIVPSVKPADSLNEAYEKTWEYLHASPKERATQRDASQLVEQVRANAAKFGVELSDTEAMKAAMELERDQARAAPSELAPARRQAKNYPDPAPRKSLGAMPRLTATLNAPRLKLRVGFTSNRPASIHWS
jgi:hypothetical protein